MRRFLIAAFLLAPLVCLAQVVKQTTDIYIVNQDGQVKLRALDSTMQTNLIPWIEFGSQTNVVFQLPANGILPVAYGGTGTNSVAASKSALGIQTGTCVTVADGTVTNAFTTAFSSAPIVVAAQFGLAGNSATNIIQRITTTNFVIKTSQASTTNNWIAIGAP